MSGNTLVAGRGGLQRRLPACCRKAFTEEVSIVSEMGHMWQVASIRAYFQRSLPANTSYDGKYALWADIVQSGGETASPGRAGGADAR